MSRADPATGVEELFPTRSVESFWARVDRRGDDDCWRWLGSGRSGYGTFSFRHEGRVLGARAHRIAYRLTVGAIPSGLQLDHLCRTPCCVNPAHLEPVTRLENMRRAFAFPNRVVLLDRPKHNATTYNRGCRCDACRDANTKRARDRKQRLLRTFREVSPQCARIGAA